MAPRPSQFFTIQLYELENGSYITDISGNPLLYNANATLSARSGYDGKGALMYIIVVIFMYGLSIVFMICGSMKKSNHDNAMHHYIKDTERVKKLEKKQEKFKAKLLIHNKRYHHILGSDRADITLDDDWFLRKGIAKGEKRLSITLNSPFRGRRKTPEDLSDELAGMNSPPDIRINGNNTATTSFIEDCGGHKGERDKGYSVLCVSDDEEEWNSSTTMSALGPLHEESEDTDSD